MRCRAVPGGETLSRNNEGGSVRSEVEEELAENVKSEKTIRGELVEGEANSEEESSQNCETHQLDWLSADGIDSEDGDPITRNSTGTNQDQVTDSIIAELLVDLGTLGVSDSLQNNGVVEAQTIKGHIKEQP